MVLFEVLSSVIATFVVSVLVWWYRAPRRSKNYPPGPRRFGFLGSIPNFILGSNLIKLGNLWCDLSKTYGSITSFDLGPLPMVFIDNVQILKKALCSDALHGRPTLPLAQLFKDCRGFSMRAGEDSKEIQQFTIRKLKQLGMGKSSQGPMIVAEVEELVKCLRLTLNQPISTEYLFNVSSFNVLWKTMSGKRFALDDPVARKLLHGLCSFGKKPLKPALSIAVSKVWKWIPIYFDDFKELQNMARLLFMNLLQDRKSKLHLDLNSDIDQVEDLAHAFARKIESTTNVNSAFHGEKGYENAAVAFWELLAGGIETTGTTLSWLCLHLALHPDKQKKLQEEIDRLKGRTPILDDRIQMPFVEATINETLRKSVVLPFGLARITIQDTKIGEYEVPKNVLVMGSIHNIHNCPKAWGDPENFRPERWLTVDEKALIKHEAFLPFGTGKKQCPGQTLTRDTLFLTTTRLFSEFHVSVNPNEPRPSTETSINILTPPPCHTLIFSQRKQV